MGGGSSRSAVDQQARRVARLDRVLGDGLRRQGVVEVLEPHGGRGYGRRRRPDTGS
jgi:hypothetical protein